MRFALALTLLALAASASHAGVIRARVYDLRTGLPLRMANAFIIEAKLSAQTDSTGWFVMDRVPSGDPILRVQASWYDAWIDTVHVANASDTVRLQIPLRRVPVPGTLSGLVVSEGKPVRHAHIRVNGVQLEETSDDDGLFSFYGAPPRPDTLQVSALGFDPVRASFLGEETRNTAIVVDLGRSLLAGGRKTDPVLRNPVDTVACVRFTLPDTSKVRTVQSLRRRLVTLDILQGDRPVRKLMWWKTLPSEYTVAWDGRDDAGQALPAGKYRWRLVFDTEPAIEGEISKR